MARLQSCIVFFCLLTAFASTARTQTQQPTAPLPQRCAENMEFAKKWLASFNPTAPNAEQSFQNIKRQYDQWVDHCKKNIQGWVAPFAFEYPKNPSTPEEAAYRKLF